jgi:N-acetylmuramoyl-L-alanine amidase
MEISVNQKSSCSIAQLLDIYGYGRTTLRYRQLAVGILMTIATGYISPVVGQAQAQSSISASNSSNTLKLNGIRPTATGLMLTVNANPQIQIQREDNPDRLIVDLQNTTLIQDLHQATVPMNRLGIKQVRVAQFQTSPAITRLVFDLDSSDPNSKTAWQSQYIAATKTLLLTPSNQVAQAIPINPSLPIYRPINPPNTSAPAAIERLSFSNTGQLLIEANQAVSYQTSLNSSSGTFNLTVPNSKISPNLQRPSLASNSPIERIKLSQVGNSVEIGIKTIAGWQVRETQRQSNQQIKLQVSANRISQIPQNNPPPLLNNSQSGTLPQNTDRQGRGVIVIDPGHGGPDVGATRNGIYEKDIALSISKYLGGTLQQMGYAVIYTRTNDIDLDLEPRVQIAERAGANAFVSVHVNSLDVNASSISGVETYHSRGSTVGNELANAVHAQILSATGANDRSVRGAGFYVIAKTSMPAILVETGYITNPSESANLTNPTYQKRMADAIAKGIDQFMRVRGR